MHYHNTFMPVLKVKHIMQIKATLSKIGKHLTLVSPTVSIKKKHCGRQQFIHATAL